MRRMIYFIVTLFALFYIDNAFALCTNNEKSLYKKITSNINISYDYHVVNNKPLFDITLSNVFNVYMEDENGNRHDPDANNQIILTGKLSGKSYKYTFYGGPTCTGQKISILYAQTPTYNKYYNLEVCDDAREYKLCQKWVSHGLSREDFVINVQNYKKERDSKPEEPVKSKFSVLSFILSLFTNIWFYVVLIPIIIFIVIKIVKAKKDKQKFGF